MSVFAWFLQHLYDIFTQTLLILCRFCSKYKFFLLSSCYTWQTDIQNTEKMFRGTWVGSLLCFNSPSGVNRVVQDSAQVRLSDSALRNKARIKTRHSSSSKPNWTTKVQKSIARSLYWKRTHLLWALLMFFDGRENTAQNIWAREPERTHYALLFSFRLTYSICTYIPRHMELCRAWIYTHILNLVYVAHSDVRNWNKCQWNLFSEVVKMESRIHRLLFTRPPPLSSWWQKKTIHGVCGQRRH